MEEVIHGPVCALCEVWDSLGPSARHLCLDPTNDPGATDHSVITKKDFTEAQNYLRAFWGNSLTVSPMPKEG